MIRKSNHLHRYKKVNLSKKGNIPFLVYKCVSLGCTHYIPIHLSEGKECECSRCGEMMIITKKTLIHSGGKPMLRPHCESCIKKRKVSDDMVTSISSYLDDLGKHK